MFFVLCYLKFVHMVVLLHDPTVALELLVVAVLALLRVQEYVISSGLCYYLEIFLHLWIFSF